MPDKNNYNQLVEESTEKASILCRKSCNKTKCLENLKDNLFLIFLLLGIVSGILIGVLVTWVNPDFHLNRRNVMYLGFPGVLLLRMLQCMIIPLITTTLISGMASIPTNTSSNMISIAILFYITSTFLAVLLGILLVTIIEPGVGVDTGRKFNASEYLVNPVDAMLDLIR